MKTFGKVLKAGEIPTDDAWYWRWSEHDGAWRPGHPNSLDKDTVARIRWAEMILPTTPPEALAGAPPAFDEDAAEKAFGVEPPPAVSAHVHTYSEDAWFRLATMAALEGLLASGTMWTEPEKTASKIARRLVAEWRKEGEGATPPVQATATNDIDAAVLAALVMAEAGADHLEAAHHQTLGTYGAGLAIDPRGTVTDPAGAYQALRKLARERGLVP